MQAYLGPAAYSHVKRKRNSPGTQNILLFISERRSLIQFLKNHFIKDCLDRR